MMIDERQKEVFYDETIEQLDELNEKLMAFEQDRANMSYIDDIFRITHTLKGSAGFVGLEKMKEISHNMESIFSGLKNDRLQASDELVDVLFKGFDKIKELLEVFKSGGSEDEIDCDDVISSLKEFNKGSAVKESTLPSQGSEADKISFEISPFDSVRVVSMEQEGYYIYEIIISFKEDTAGKELKALLLYSNLNNVGEIIASVPSYDDIQNGKLDNKIGFLVASKEDASYIKNILDIEGVGNVIINKTTFIEDKGAGPDNESKSSAGVDDGGSQIVDAHKIIMRFKDEGNKGERAVKIIKVIGKHAQIKKIDPSMDKIKSGDFDSITLIVVNTDVGAIKRDIQDNIIQEFILKNIKIKIKSKASPQNVKTTQLNKDDEKHTLTSNKKKSNISIKSDTSQMHYLSTTKTVKVSVDKLDQLLNLVGELVVINSGFANVLEELKNIYGYKGVVIEFRDRIEQLRRVSKELQEGIMQSRLVSIGQVFSKFSRPVRDLAKERGKEVELILKGQETELDKKIVDMIGEPLLHLVRNAIDHGIETPEERELNGKPIKGKLILNAYQSGNQVVIEVSDDGRGLDKEKILKKAISLGLTTENEAMQMTDEEIYNFIFLPGFSTAEIVTDVSGRGMGMDIVKSTVTNLNGSIEIETEYGKGTTFVVSFPLTLAIITAIIVRVYGEMYAIPISSIKETVMVDPNYIKTIENYEVVKIRDSVIPILRLAKAYNVQVPEGEDEEIFFEFPLIIASYRDREIGIIVSEIIGKQEVVIKSLSENYRMVEGLSGATILGDGRVALIIDVPTLVNTLIKEELKRKFRRQMEIEYERLMHPQESKPLDEEMEDESVSNDESNESDSHEKQEDTNDITNDVDEIDKDNIKQSEVES